MAIKDRPPVPEISDTEAAESRNIKTELSGGALWQAGEYLFVKLAFPPLSGDANRTITFYGGIHDIARLYNSLGEFLDHDRAAATWAKPSHRAAFGQLPPTAEETAR